MGVKRYGGLAVGILLAGLLVFSDSQAAYADSAMDGVAFDRENLGPRFRLKVASGRLR
jgi:hypothetical protein